MEAIMWPIMQMSLVMMINSSITINWAAMQKGQPSEKADATAFGEVVLNKG